MFRFLTSAHLSATLLCFCGVGAASAQTPAPASTAPGIAYFQNATLIGSTNAISVTHLPVIAGGKTYYWDLLLPFDVDTAGNVIAGSLTSTASHTLIDSAFSGGTYHSPSTILAGKGLIVLTGPGLWNGFYTQWTITSATGADNCTYPESGAFYVAPNLSSNPIYSRLKAAGITSTAWSYGTGSSNCNPYAAWPDNGIIGVSQVGNTLTIASFSSTAYGFHDTSTPTDQITYTLQ